MKDGVSPSGGGRDEAKAKASDARGKTCLLPRVVAKLGRGGVGVCEELKGVANAEVGGGEGRIGDGRWSDGRNIAKFGQHGVD